MANTAYKPIIFYGYSLRHLISFIAGIGIAISLNSCSRLSSNRVVQSHEYVFLRDDPYTEPLKLRQVDLKHLESLCLPKYNYWCIKTPASEHWHGQVGQDLAGHAIFKNPVYSARAFTRIMRTYHKKHKLRTTRQIINRYAPKEDCIGSKAFCPIDTKYLYGIKGMPYGKIGDQWVQYSKKIYPGYKEGGSCLVKLMYCPRGFNPTNDYAEFLAKSVNKGVDEDLELFDSDGTIDMKVAVPLFSAFSRWEIGSRYKIDPRLIISGILLERRDFLQHQKNLYLPPN